MVRREEAEVMAAPRVGCGDMECAVLMLPVWRLPCGCPRQTTQPLPCVVSLLEHLHARAVHGEHVLDVRKKLVGD